MTSADELSRFAVKSDHATITIPELQLEIPPQTQKGSVSTIEGFIRNTIEGLRALQVERMKVDPDTATQIDQFIVNCESFADGEHFPFTFLLDDPSGNSFVQNPSAPDEDPKCKREEYEQLPRHLFEMGYIDESKMIEEEEKRAKQGSDKTAEEKKGPSVSKVKEEDLAELSKKMLAHQK